MMNKYRIQSGISLIEMVVVTAVVGILAAISTPAVKGLYNSMVTEGSAKSMVQAALSNARSIAISRQKYAGVRFQQDTKGNQYMIFVVHNSETDSFFNAVEGRQPVKLPDNFRVTDLRIRENYSSETDPDYDEITDNELQDSGNLISGSYNNKLDGINKYIFDSTTFTIVFSPSGKVIIREARMRNRDGITYPDNFDGSVSNDSWDNVFNSEKNVLGESSGKFIQDYYAKYGLGNEYSRRYFVIYDKDKFKQMDGDEREYYLFDELEPIYINPYSGELVKRK
jgi:prepilin-type N-terminal cleavage/methylation domain-containing protein